MSDLNTLSIQGRVVQDAELKVSGDVKVLNFTVAVNRARKNNEGKWESIGNFFPLSIFGSFAESMQPLLKKGQQIIVEGYLKQDRWIQDGKNRSATAIGVNKIHLIAYSKQRRESSETNTVPAAEFESMSQIYDEPPEEIYMDLNPEGALF